MTEPVSIAVVGAGNRGQTYADLAAVDGHARVVAVADPDCARRQELADRHAVTAARRFDGWEALVGGPQIADRVVVATQDRFYTCPYAAPKIYLPCLSDPTRERWPLQPVMSDRNV